MSRIFLSALIAAPLLLASVGNAAPVVTRGNLTYDGIPDQPLDSAAALQAYLGARQATPLGFTPKGALLIATRFGDVDELHLVEHAGAERRQITFEHAPISAGAYSPDPAHEAFFYLEDAAGDGRTQIYYERAGELAPRRLTDGKSVNAGALWSNSGRKIAFFTTARDGASYDIDVVEPESGALPRVVLTGDGAAWCPLDWSADDRKLLVRERLSASEDHLFIVDLDTGERREVDPSASKGRIPEAKFSRDGTGVYILTDRDGEFPALRYVNVFTGEHRAVAGRGPWGVGQFALSSDGHYLAYTTNEGGYDALGLVDLRAHQDLIAPKPPVRGVIDDLSFDREGRRLAFGLAAPNQPRDAYVLDLETNRLEAWTASEWGPMDRSRFVLPRLTEFPTFDRTDGKQRQIPLFVYEPATPGPHPVLIVLAAGPHAEFRPDFDPWIEYVVNELGYAVLAPNVRGSSGYGKSYRALDQGTLRGDAIKDMGALLVWIGLDSRFDARHVVVSGGYLALATLVNYSERLRGAVDFAGITDFIDYLGTTAPYLQRLARAEYGDEHDTDRRAYLRGMSPLTGADRITRPILEVHGKRDPVVPLAQSEELANRLRSRGGAVWLLEAGDEGHAFRRLANREAYYRTFAEFLASLR